MYLQAQVYPLGFAAYITLALAIRISCTPSPSMSIDDLANIAGVLGFVISLATFALTRWERRALVHFSLETG
jgi:hypothetical protein